MTKGRIRALLALSLAALISCTTLKAPRSDDDAVLVIPVTVTASSAGFGQFTLRIDPTDGGVHTMVTLSFQGSYTLVTGLKAGEYTFTRMTFTQTSGKTEPFQQPTYRIRLEGKSISILPQSFDCQLYSEWNTRYTRAGWSDVSQDHANRIAAELAKNKETAAWKFSTDTMENPIFRVAIQKAGLVQ